MTYHILSFQVQPDYTISQVVLNSAIAARQHKPRSSISAICSKDTIAGLYKQTYQVMIIRREIRRNHMHLLGIMWSAAVYAFARH